jgi:UDP:flavonoid glycosyltransferase YjiC (YdhE family)
MICLLPSCDSLSGTSRMIAIGRALEARGADVRVATHAGPYEWLLRDAGLEYDLLGGDGARAREAAEAEHLRAIGARVVVTGRAFTAHESSRRAGIPLVTAHAGSWVPPMWERGLLPLPFEPLGIPLERCVPRPLRRRMFNARAADLAADPAAALGDVTLVTDLPQMLGITGSGFDAWRPRDPARYRQGARLKLVGPIPGHLDVPLPGRIERLLAGPRPIAYVAITSSEPRLVRSAVGALRPLGARILVASTVHDLAGLEDDQVAVERFLPSALVMPQVDLAVIAGGQGSVHTALAAGAPFLGLPLGPEQHLNVALAERDGAALALDPRLAGTPDLTRRARELMTATRYRAAAERLRGAFERADGPGRAAEAIVAAASGVAVHPG